MGEKDVAGRGTGLCKGTDIGENMEYGACRKLVLSARLNRVDYQQVHLGSKE